MAAITVEEGSHMKWNAMSTIRDIRSK